MKNPVAIVTGGSRGIGAAIVRTLATEGWDVFFTYLQDQNAAENIVREVEALGRRSEAVQADARDFGRAEQTVAMAHEKFGDISALICNAGLGIGVLLHETTEEQWDTVIDTCLKGPFSYIRAVAPLFIKQQHGKIVCVGSINAQRARPNSSGYNAAKSGLEGLVKTAATELGLHNINVNVVAPGFVGTKPPEQYPPERKQQLLKECAIKRLGTPEDIAPVVTFLCSDEARHITGHILTVDAGQSLSQPLYS